jgi:Fic family protein
MTLYWPAFEFAYSLDMAHLLPYLAAVESSKVASSSYVLPPPWRERACSGESMVALCDASAQEMRNRQIQLRKLELLNNNASRAQAWVRQRFVPGSAPISLDDILAMHRMVADEAGIRYDNVGVLRKDGQKVVVGDAGIGYHVGAPAIRLPHLMEDYLQFITSASLTSMPAPIHALVAHFFLATIHPFEDGSGRVSRLVAAGILFQRGYNGHGFHALSSHFYENQERYYRIVFKQQQEPCPDLTEFIAFGLEGLALELRGISSFIKVKLDRVVYRETLVASRKQRRSRRLQAPL